MQPKILITIVLYKENLENSASYKTIKKAIQKVGFVSFFYIHDNSPNPQNISHIEINGIYFYTPENKGLSHAYNNAAKYAQQNFFDWILLLDQDTIWAEDFFIKLFFAMKKNTNIKLFSPIIKVENNKPFSPIKLFLAQPIYKHGAYNIKNKIIINSGMVIYVDSFIKCGGYDEKVFLDFSDMRFLDKLSTIESKFYLFETIGLQNFSNQENNLKKLLDRFRIYLTCGKNYHKQGIFNLIILNFNILKHTIALTFRTKNIIFLKLFLTNYLFK